MKTIHLIFFLFLLVHQANSQSSQIRAQARYYSAKSQYEKGDYSGTLKSVKESKEILGGTNFLLQYLHIMSAYNNGNYKEAQTEMDKYFKLLDKKETPISFSRSVEELSSDETTDLVKLLDKIDEHVANNTEEKIRIENEERRKAKEREIAEIERRNRQEKEFQDCVEKCVQTIKVYLFNNEVPHTFKGKGDALKTEIDVERTRNRTYNVVIKETIRYQTDLHTYSDVNFGSLQKFEVQLQKDTEAWKYYQDVVWFRFDEDFKRVSKVASSSSPPVWEKAISIDTKPEGRMVIQENCSCLTR